MSREGGVGSEVSGEGCEVLLGREVSREGGEVLLG